jgi:hypothetical protein
MKSFASVVAIIVVVFGGGYAVYYYTQPQNVVINQPSAATSTSTATGQLLADAYPLYVYAGLTWQAEVPNTMSFGDTHTPSIINGYETDSQPIADGSDPAAVFQSLTQYYADKLNQLGWVEDQTLAASSSENGVVAYAKNNQYIILSYDAGTFSIFTGTGQ